MRRFLPCFLIVVVVSLSIECLATWGLFVRMNVDAEKLEPHTMRKVQAEDSQVAT